MKVSVMDCYKPEWSWNDKIHYWIKKQLVGRTLHFPCGTSQIGDVRADASEKVKPDIIADLFKPLDYFKRFEFDTVLCDPPYHFYKEQAWIHGMAEIATKRFILRTPCMAIHLKRRVWIKQYHIMDYRASYNLDLFQIFDRRNEFIVKP